MRPSRCLSLLALPLLATALSAADGGLSIARWGNALLVTAPGGAAPTGALATRLNQRVTVDFKDTPVEEVADFLRKLSGANIVVAPAVTTSGALVTLKASNMSLGNVLHWVTKLTGTHIGYVHGAIYLADKPLEEASVTRLYDISDLTMPLQDFAGPELALNAGGAGGAGGGALFKPAEESNAAPTHDEIIEIIQKVIKPGQWNN